jgi:hypothetical protein
MDLGSRQEAARHVCHSLHLTIPQHVVAIFGAADNEPPTSGGFIMIRVHFAARRLPRDQRLWMCFQQPCVIDEILRIPAHRERLFRSNLNTESDGW